MLRWIARYLLFRFLPRRLLPIITVIEVARFVRGLRRSSVRVNEPARSRTAPPPAGLEPGSPREAPELAEPGEPARDR